MAGLRYRTLPLFVLLALCWPALVQAQGTKAGVVTTLQGRVTAARAALLQPVALKFKDDVFLNDRIVTDDRSIVRLLLGGKALVTVRERSTLPTTGPPAGPATNPAPGRAPAAATLDRSRPAAPTKGKQPTRAPAVRPPSSPSCRAVSGSSPS